MTAARSESGAHGGERTREAAAAALPDRIALLGLGLIGGSVAMALRTAGYAGTLAAWTPDGRGPAEAKRRRIIDEAGERSEAAIEGAGLVILAGPPLAILAQVDELAGPLRRRLADGANITDVASTKARIVAAADRHDLPFVGGHPMAGRETSGMAAAIDDLFIDRPWVLVPGSSARPEGVVAVEALAAATGARAMQLTAPEHDAAVAAISHLPLVVSAALVEAVASGPGRNDLWPLAASLAAGGWRDTTRIARGDPEMGAGILATNAQPVADGLRALRHVIDGWLEQLEAAEPVDAERLRRRLEAAQSALVESGE